MDQKQKAGPDNSGHFGYRNVSPQEKTRLVRGVFDSVAQKYDLMNDLMSGGIHRLWKDAFVRQANPQPGQVCLDLAGGTGDIAFRLRKHMDQVNQAKAGNGHVFVADINASMLEVGRDRAIDHGLMQGLSWLCTNAESLPMPDRCADLYTIAFGIRNVTYIDKALEEAFRTLRHGGRFFCLEFSKPAAPLQPLYDFYSFRILPHLGSWVAGDAESYAYLAESIRRFPERDAFARMIEAAGFKRVQYHTLSGGIAAIHWGWKV